MLFSLVLVTALLAEVAVTTEVPAWVAIILAVGTGAVVKLIDRWWASHQKGRQLDVDAATQIRGELRAELAELRDDLEDVNDRLDKWRDRYFQLRYAYNNVKGACKLMRIELMVVRGEIGSDELKKIRISPATGQISGLDKALLAVITEGEFNDKHLDAIDAEVHREQATRRRKPKEKEKDKDEHDRF